MKTSKFSFPANFSGEVRLFPLPNVVIFPNTVNPLRVFESRYREMFEDAVAGDQLLATATLLPGYESDYYSRPPIAPTVCIGHIAQHRRNADGTYDFLLVGMLRANIQSEVTPVRSYRRAKVQLLPDQHVPSDENLQELGNTLAYHAKDAIPNLKSMFDAFYSRDLSLASLTDAIAQYVDLDLDDKIKLLQQTDPLQRAALLLNHLRQPLASRRQPRFSDN